MFKYVPESQIPQLTVEFFEGYYDEMYDQYCAEMLDIHEEGVLSFARK